MDPDNGPDCFGEEVKAVGEFVDLLETKGRKLRNRKTPLPVAQSWYQEKLEEAKRQDPGSRETVEKDDSAEPGWLADVAMHFVGVIGYTSSGAGEI